MRSYSILALALTALLLVGCGSDTRYTIAATTSGELTDLSTAYGEITDDETFKEALDEFTEKVAIFKDLAERTKKLPPMKGSGVKKIAKEVQIVQRELDAKMGAAPKYLQDNADKMKQLKDVYTKIQASLKLINGG